ncbi:MAG: hypothetical protein IJQ98_08375 [Oscillospiraceae bacterium]|nr:hypothetical protein [Oscillospiraceae bacterium]
MADTIISLDDVREIDRVLDEMEENFSLWGVPTIRRLRAGVLTEELFAALRELDAEDGRLRCSFPSPRTMELQYRGTKGPLNPDLSMMERLARNPCMEGVRFVSREGRCVIAAKE